MLCVSQGEWDFSIATMHHLCRSGEADTLRAQMGAAEMHRQTDLIQFAELARKPDANQQASPQKPHLWAPVPCSVPSPLSAALPVLLQAAASVTAAVLMGAAV